MKPKFKVGDKVIVIKPKPDLGENHHNEILTIQKVNENVELIIPENGYLTIDENNDSVSVYESEIELVTKTNKILFDKYNG